MDRVFLIVRLTVMTGLLVAALVSPDSDAELVSDVNTAGDEYGPTLSPDGSELCYTTRVVRERQESIVCVRRNDNKWDAPKALSFSGKGFDKEPYFSPDGRRLYFASQRAVPGSSARPNFDLWVATRTGSGWSDPVHLGSAVNTDGYENYPAVAANGNLYFARRNADTQNDLYISRPTTGAYRSVERLPNGVNTPHTDADPYVAPDESYIIFSSDRPGGAGEGDLYITRRNGSAWSAPRALGPKVNSADYEYTPFVSPDGQWLYFSRGWGEIWRIRMSELPLQ
jgi:Tol biopolymer transport system component